MKEFDAHKAFGFGKHNYITIFRGDGDVISKWSHETKPCRARYNQLFGWYLPWNLIVEKFPEGVTPVKLMWKEVCDENDPTSLRDYDEVREIVALKTCIPSKSEFQGEVGKWIERDLIVKRNIALADNYGAKQMHIMWDKNENEYVWTTASKNYAPDTELKLKMKVKEHKTYKMTKQTVVWYCKEIKQ